jgi:hypothetical protein
MASMMEEWVVIVREGKVLHRTECHRVTEYMDFLFCNHLQTDLDPTYPPTQ